MSQFENPSPELLSFMRAIINDANAATGTKSSKPANLSPCAISWASSVPERASAELRIVEMAGRLFSDRHKVFGLSQYDPESMSKKFFHHMWEEPEKLALLNNCCSQDDCPQMKYQRCLVDAVEDVAETASRRRI